MFWFENVLHLVFCSNFIYSGDYCEVNFCQNGGTCVTGVGEDPFICICVDGFGGDTCNLTDTGKDHGKSKSNLQLINALTSFCVPLVSGPCSPNPCKNDGLCEVITPTRRGDVFSEYICKCQSSFEGVHCQISKSVFVDLYYLLLPAVVTWSPDGFASLVAKCSTFVVVCGSWKKWVWHPDLHKWRKSMSTPLDYDSESESQNRQIDLTPGQVMSQDRFKSQQIILGWVNSALTQVKPQILDWNNVWTED